MSNERSRTLSWTDPADTGRVVAEGHVAKPGSRAALVGVDITDGSGPSVA